MGKITDLDEIRTLAITLMFEHKLNGWKFVFTTAVRQYGHCSHRQKVIGISKHISPMNSLEETRNTILHEIAHALVGPGHGHDQVWKNMAVEIGCTGDRCYDSSEVTTPKRKWKGECPGCKRVSYYHRRASVSCGKCSCGSFNPKFRLEYSEVE